MSGSTQLCAHLKAAKDHAPNTPRGCEECLKTGDRWVHLRLCLTCGHVGCCDDSPNHHATRHHHATGHPVIKSFEPGETWFWDFPSEQMVDGPPLAPPEAHPADQPAPGPRGRVPADWQVHLR